MVGHAAHSVAAARGCGGGAGVGALVVDAGQVGRTAGG